MNELITKETPQAIAIREQFGTNLRQQITTKRLMIGGAGVVGLAVVLPIAVMAVQAGAALVVVGTLGFGGYVAWRRIPLWIQRLENSIIEANQAEMNRHLAALKQEARTNPIEQRENSLKARIEQLKAVKQFLGQIAGKVETWAGRLEEREKTLKAQDRTEDLSKERAAVEKVRKFYMVKKGRYDAAVKACEMRREMLESLRFKWEFAKDGGELAGQLDPAAEEAFINDLLDDEAARQVETDFNTVFAQLDLDISEVNSGDKLTFDDKVIDISSIHIPTAKEIQHVQ